MWLKCLGLHVQGLLMYFSISSTTCPRDRVVMCLVMCPLVLPTLLPVQQRLIVRMKR